MTWLLLLHAFATLFMAGLIWFVQVVHYPLFARVGPAQFVEYEHQHTMRTGWVVMAPMVIEALTATVLVRWHPEAVPAWAVWLGVVLLAIVWASTALQQMPAHRRLLEGYDPQVQRRLVRTNWIRTWAWTARAVLALWFVLAASA